MGVRIGAVSDNLPVSLSSLVGRHRDLDVIKSMLARDDVRLVTITGVGGVGKTRLALAAATHSRQHYEAVWLVELASVHEPDLVVAAIAATIGIREEAGTPLLRMLADALRSQRALLLLDTCEHLLGSTARATEQLLSHCPRLTILATSRQRLRVPGERVWPAQPLPVPPSTDRTGAVHLGQSDAVQLFAARALATQPNFVLDDMSMPTVAAICRQLDGLPLAIELAARWVSVLTVDEIMRRLDDRFRLLVDGSQTTVRQQTLRAAVAWSYDLLPSTEQLLFTRLAVFADGCSLEAIEAVCADGQLAPDEIVHHLARLVDASLVSRLDGAGQTRYRALDTLRLFARERLVLSGHADELYRRHAEFYLALAERAEPALWGPQLLDWLNRLDAEHDNLRAALRWTTGRGDVEISLRLGAALGRFWQLRGHATEGLRWLDSALIWQLGSDPTHRARALDTAGQLARDRGDQEASQRYYAASLAIRRATEDWPGTARALHNLATVMHITGDHDDAVALLEESLTLFQELRDEPGEALTLVTLGTIAQLQQNMALAIERYRDGLAMFRRLDDRRGIAATLNNLGNLASQHSDDATAEEYYQESLQLFRALGDDHDIAACLGNLARLARDRHDVRHAVEYGQQSLAHFAALGSQHGLAASMRLLAELALSWGDPVRAATLQGAGSTMHEAVGPSPDAAHELVKESPYGQVSDDALRRGWAEGKAMTPEAAIVYALEVWQEPRSTTVLQGRHRGDGSPLTRREREVAALIARGLTNRQIAEALFIAERTADTHVEHILTKLNVTSRAQVAAWAVVHDLAGER